MTKRKKVKRVKTKEERAVEEASEVARPGGEEGIVEEEASEVTRPGGEEKGVEEEPQEETEESREPAVEIPQPEAVPEERPPLKSTVLTQCMRNPSFRTRVIYHLVKKLRSVGRIP